MDDKQRRPRRGHKSAPSTDGMVSGGRKLGAPIHHKSYQPSRDKPTPSFDSFTKRADGFYPAQQTGGGFDRAESEEANLLDEPIVLDHIKPKKTKKGARPKHRGLKKFLKRTAFILMLIVIAGGTCFGYKVYNTQKRVLAGGGKAATVCSDDVDISQLHREGDSRINILLLGIGGPGHDGANLTDTIMLASIDPITNKTTLMSIPRDLWVRIPGDGSQKINAAYADAVNNSTAKDQISQETDGITQLDKTLQPVLDGVRIHYHVLLDFPAFKQMVDALGGVTVNVPETLYDPTVAWENHNNPVLAKKGIQTFNGDQALLYSRSRETSSDFARGERQRLIITAIKQKAFSAGTFTNPLKVSSLLDSLGQNVYTDFSSSDIKCLLKQIQTIPASAFTSLDMVTPPNQLLTTGNINGLSVVEPRAGLYNYSAIHTFLHKSLLDGLIVKENAPVAVYNATAASGVATAASNTLKEYGYNVIVTANAATNNPSTTTIVDLSKGTDKYTKHYLEARYGVAAVKKMPAGSGITPPVNAKFVIILGEDVASSTTSG